MRNARRAKRDLARELDASFDAAAAGALAEISAPSSKRAAARPEAGAADRPAPSAAPARAPARSTTAPESGANPLAVAKLWASLGDLRDGLGPYEEEKLIATARAFLAGQLPLGYWTRTLNALAETKRGAGAAYGLRWR
jgi:hypothetical protein